MGIDKIFTIPIPFSILLNDSVLYRFSYQFSFGKKGQQTGRLASSLFSLVMTLQTQQQWGLRRPTQPRAPWWGARGSPEKNICFENKYKIIIK